jgi:hypothetical protein
MGVRWNRVKVFSATKPDERNQLGERMTEWIAAHPRYELVDIVVTQSSDAEFHCLAMSVFYFENARAKPGR